MFKHKILMWESAPQTEFYVKKLSNLCINLYKMIVYTNLTLEDDKKDRYSLHINRDLVYESTYS